MEVKHWENQNVTWWWNMATNKMRAEFKPDCPQEIKEMWAKLNKPIKYKGEKRKWQKRNSKRFIRLKF